MANRTSGRKKLTLPILLLVFALCEGLLFYGLLKVTGDLGKSMIFATIVPGSIVAYAVSAILSVLVHEVGHYAVGRLCGFNFYGIQVFCFQLSKLSTGYKFQILDLNTAGGRIYMTPSAINAILLKKRLLLLAGPLASLLLTIVSFSVVGPFRRT